MTLSRSNVVTFRYDVIHILNELHNNPLYSELGSVISPQGLVALILSSPDTPTGIEHVVNQLEMYDRNCVGKLKDPNAFLVFCESISLEIDQASHFAFELAGFGVVTPTYFYSWNNLSILTVIASILQEDNNELKQLSARQADSFRYYDGNHAVGGGAGVHFGPL